MAKKTNKAIRKAQTRPASDDTAVWKVLGALILMILTLVVLGKAAELYKTADGFDIVYPGSRLCSLICAGLFAASAVLLIVFRKQPLVREISFYVLVLSLLEGLTGLVLRKSWTDEMVFLYILHCLVYCSYMIYQIYRMEFFLVSLDIGFSGALFYSLSRGVTASLPNFILCAALALAVLSSCILARKAGKNAGSISLRGEKYRVFPASFTPLPIYIICAVALVCLIAGLLLGSLFFYYAMFAAIAIELIAAVYYTFQLK
jgi:hypothetical protein